MKVEDLLNGIEVLNDISNFKNTEIKSISTKAQQHMDDGMFFCYKGAKDGYALIEEAKTNGAICFVVDHFVDKQINQIIVKDVRKAIGLVAGNFYNTKNIKVIGITGTNGKTTTSFIIQNILKQAHKKVGVIGTNGIYYADKFLPAVLTTPDPIDLHEIFSIMKKDKVDYIVMEVSAHAIALQKIAGINFVCKILTNVTQDHLDFFNTMEKYKQTKLSFFNKNDLMIVNSDDQCGQNLLKRYDSCISYGLNNPSDIFSIEIDKTCSNYIMNICDNVINIKSNLYGMFNVYNCMAGAGCCYYLGIDIDDIEKGINSTQQVSGRFNVINNKNSKIIIDYAHTPDGLENVLKTARKMTEGKLTCLFGCGGDRDKSKRKIMGLVAEKYSDFCIVTSDNPRSEHPQNIINDILQGFNKKNYYSIIDRSLAIKIAINSLKAGDILIICGKGAEDYIDIKGQKLPYSDFETVNKILKGEL